MARSAAQIAAQKKAAAASALKRKRLAGAKKLARQKVTSGITSGMKDHSGVRYPLRSINLAKSSLVKHKPGERTSASGRATYKPKKKGK